MWAGTGGGGGGGYEVANACLSRSAASNCLTAAGGLCQWGERVGETWGTWGRAGGGPRGTMLCWLAVLYFLVALCGVEGHCPKMCNGHGTCGSGDKCTCYAGYNATTDCSERTSPRSVAEPPPAMPAVPRPPPPPPTRSLLRVHACTIRSHTWHAIQLASHRELRDGHGVGRSCARSRDRALVRRVLGPRPMRWKLRRMRLLRRLHGGRLRTE